MKEFLLPLVAPAAPRWYMAPRMSHRAFCSSEEIPSTFIAACSLVNCCDDFCLSSDYTHTNTHNMSWERINKFNRPVLKYTIKSDLE